MKKLSVTIIFLLTMTTLSFAGNYDWDDKEAVDRMAGTLNHIQNQNSTTYQGGEDSGNPFVGFIVLAGFAGFVIYKMK